jgi:hypothetical protein
MDLVSAVQKAALGQRRALNEFAHQAAATVDGAGIVQRDDARMRVLWRA